MRERIFLYGTLRRGASRDATLHYDNVQYVGAARVRGRLHDFGEYPGLRLDPFEGWVVGEVFEVTPETLAQLDVWEGLPAGCLEGSEYRRVWQPVELAGGDTMPCWVYEVNANVCLGADVIASGDWLERG